MRVRSVCQKIFVLFGLFVFKKNSDLWFILVEHEIIVFEHEIRRRPTDRREVIKRITRIIYCTRISRITRIFYNEILNTNSTNYTAYASHGSRIKNIRLIRLITSLRSVGLRRISCSKIPCKRSAFYVKIQIF